MNTLDYVSLALGGGLSLAAVIYALYTNHSLSSTIAGQASLIIGLGSKLSDSDRNALSYQQQRDSEKEARVKAEAERDDALSRLVLAQKALAAADKETVDAATEAVRTAPDPLDALQRVLASSDRSGVPAAASPRTGGGGQGNPAL